jgi:hypothetical protein
MTKNFNQVPVLEQTFEQKDIPDLFYGPKNCIPRSDKMRITKELKQYPHLLLPVFSHIPLPFNPMDLKYQFSNAFINGLLLPT